MRLAVSAGGGSAENVAYVETLLGNLEFQAGHVARAGMAYSARSHAFPRTCPRRPGLATVQAATGDLDGAIERYEAVVEVGGARVPPASPRGEARRAAAAGAREEIAAIHENQAIERSKGVNTDAELAIFEADHGSAARGVELGRSAVRKAPSVSSADAYSWALTRAGQGAARFPLGQAGAADRVARPASPLPRGHGSEGRRPRRARAQVADAGACP